MTTTDDGRVENHRTPDKAPSPEAYALGYKLTTTKDGAKATRIAPGKIGHKTDDEVHNIISSLHIKMLQTGAKLARGFDIPYEEIQVNIKLSDAELGQHETLKDHFGNINTRKNEGQYKNESLRLTEQQKIPHIIIPNSLQNPKVLMGVESRRGAVAWALWASLRFLSPLIKPDVRISRIRLPDRLHLKAHGGGPRWTRLCRITPSSPNTTVSGKPGATRRHLMAPDQEMTYSLVRSSSLIPDNQFGSPAPPSP